MPYICKKHSDGGEYFRFTPPTYILCGLQRRKEREVSYIYISEYGIPILRVRKIPLCFDLLKKRSWEARKNQRGKDDECWLHTWVGKTTHLSNPRSKHVRLKLHEFSCPRLTVKADYSRIRNNRTFVVITARNWKFHDDLHDKSINSLSISYNGKGFEKIIGGSVIKSREIPFKQI